MTTLLGLRIGKEFLENDNILLFVVCSFHHISYLLDGIVWRREDTEREGNGGRGVVGGVTVVELI